MADYSSPYMGLKIYVTHVQKIYATGTGAVTRTIPAKIAVFSDGRYHTADEEIIKVLDEKAHRNPDTLMRVDKHLNRIEGIKAAIRERMVELDALEDEVNIKDKTPVRKNVPPPSRTRRAKSTPKESEPPAPTEEGFLVEDPEPMKDAGTIPSPLEDDFLADDFKKKTRKKAIKE